MIKWPTQNGAIHVPLKLSVMLMDKTGKVCWPNMADFCRTPCGIIIHIAVSIYIEISKALLCMGTIYCMNIRHECYCSLRVILYCILVYAFCIGFFVSRMLQGKYVMKICVGSSLYHWYFSGIVNTVWAPCFIKYKLRSWISIM